jgi:AraC-like DNA-binding protein
MPAPPSASESPPAAPRIDPLSDVLRAVKLTGALFFAVEASSPWGVEVPHEDSYAPTILPGAQRVVSYHIILDGEGWVGMAGSDPVRFEGGDILVFAHGDPYRLLSAPEQSPEFDGPATVAFLREMAAGRLPFAVEEGGGGEARTRYVCGYLGCDMRPFNPVLDALPRLLHVKGAGREPGDRLARLVELTLEAAQSSLPGGESIRLRLSELIFVEAIRRHLATRPAPLEGWLAGLGDPAVGRVLALLHNEPACSWTLDRLARRAGMSRTVLAERFAQFVGCPPMHYLTLWRMQLAARLLADSAIKVAAAAHAIGYESEAAFSRAFKKATGLSPGTWRRSAVAGHRPGMPSP